MQIIRRPTEPLEATRWFVPTEGDTANSPYHEVMFSPGKAGEKRAAQIFRSGKINARKWLIWGLGEYIEVHDGDYLIMYDNGEFNAMKPDRFERMYRVLEEDAPKVAITLVKTG
jgi:hypothetical protein